MDYYNSDLRVCRRQRSIRVDECRLNEKVIIEKNMIISTCSSPVQEQVAMGMRPNTTPLS